MIKLEKTIFIDIFQCRTCPSHHLRFYHTRSEFAWLSRIKSILGCAQTEPFTNVDSHLVSVVEMNLHVTGFCEYY